MLKHRSSLKKYKSSYYWKKYQEWSNFPKPKKQHKGRPKKVHFNSAKEYQLKDILLNPSLIQTFDLFSEIPKSLLSFVQDENLNKYQNRKRFNDWHSFNIFQQDPLQKKEFNYSDSYSNEPLKLDFFELLALVIDQTKKSLNLSEEGYEMLINIKNCFCSYIDNESKDKIAETIWELYRNNSWMNIRLEKLFNSVFFKELIEIFIKWKELFLRKFAEESPEK